MDDCLETRWPLTRAQRLAAWGQGPWIDEPDEVEFAAFGTACRLVRNELMGSWCGYVALTIGHWGYGKPYDEIDNVVDGIIAAAPTADGAPLYNVHGGLTYAEKDLPRSKRPTDREGQWWVGFDAAHGCDCIPRYTRLGWTTPYPQDQAPPPYRAQDYMMVQCAHLVILLTGLPRPTAPA